MGGMQFLLLTKILGSSLLKLYVVLQLNKINSVVASFIDQYLCSVLQKKADRVVDQVLDYQKVKSHS